MTIVKDLKDSRVLIVDDVKTNVDMLVAALRDDFKLSVALDGEAALRAVEKTPPDLVLLDLGLPDVDGLHWLSDVRKQIDHTPMLVLTARDGVDLGTLSSPPRLALLVGSEGEGITEAALTLADACATIPMAPGVDSLNVAVACGIGLDRLRR